MTNLDLTLVSDEDLNREYWRRMRARRQSTGGRPKSLRPCPKCGAQFGSHELRAHQPECIPPQRYFIDRPKSTRKKIGEGHAEYITAEGVRLAWSNAMPLPVIGATVNITMNGIGPATVEGYFMEHGYLGVMTKALKPPQWLRKQHLEGRAHYTVNTPQWIKDGIGCEFGTEIAPHIEKRARRQK